MTTDRQLQTLVELGFTSLEAEVYVCLVRESPATGYRVAQTIGKPAANTYKALASLQRKGAVIVDDARNRLCRAVPPDELLKLLEVRFRESKQSAAGFLSQIRRSESDDRLYQLQNRSQVLERARAMFDRAGHVAVMDVFPTLLLELRSAIETAHSRGIEMVVKTYRQTGVEAAHTIVRPRGNEILSAIPGDLLNLNIDGREHLLALLKKDGDDVHQAFWTASPIISYVLYNGLINEASQAAAMAELEHDTSVERLRAVFLSLRHLHPASSRGPAYQNLMKHLGQVPPQENSGSIKPG